ncbi:MAG: hypothetical protein ACREWI_08450 [Telluria sp.]
MSRSALLLCLACWTGAAQAADAPAVVRSDAQLKAVLASGQRTPLDALTPYGKRKVLASIAWGDQGMQYLNPWPLIRELDAQQLGAVLAFLGNDSMRAYWSSQVAGAPMRFPEPSPELEQRLAAFERVIADGAAQRAAAPEGAPFTRAPGLAARYARQFGDRMAPARLKRLPLGDLQPLLDAALRMEFEQPGAALTELLHLHQELGARGLDTRRTVDDKVFESLLILRRFEQARAFAAHRPALRGQAIPVVADPLGAAYSGRSLYRYDAARNTLTREAAPAPAGVQLVMVVNGGCHFSANALAALRSDAELLARLREANLLLLTPPGNSIPLEFIKQWNAANPSLPVRAPVSLGEWEAIDAPDIPGFFVLKDGKAVGRATGWPEVGNKAAVLALLDAARK